MRPAEALRRARRLTAREWADLPRAQIALFRAQLVVWFRPRGALVRRALPTAAGGVDGSHAAAASLALAVARAAEYGVFRPACLVRAVALLRLLDSRGLHGGRIRIGVAAGTGGVVAHAWVEFGGAALQEPELHVRRFKQLAEAEVLHR